MLSPRRLLGKLFPARIAVPGLLVAFGLVLAALAATTSLFSTGQQPYLQANSTNTTAIPALDGRYATVTAISATNPPFQLGSINGDRYARGTEYTFYGTGTAGSQFNYTIVALNYSLWATGDKYDDVEAKVMATGTVTLGSTFGASVRGAKSTDRLGNVITNVTSTYAGVLATAYNSPSPVVYTGTDSAKLWIPEMGNATHVMVLFQCTTATSANCYVKGDS
jgi:hypothetical protein